MRPLLKQHEEVKRTRFRGAANPPQLAVVTYLRGLEAEVERIRQALDWAWAELDNSSDFRRCSRHMDHAQQRIHRVIKRLSKKG